jgi:acetyl esterase/lipase
MHTLIIRPTIIRTAICWLVFQLALLGGARLTAAGEIEIERDVEYSNPNDAHLKLNLARPKEIEGRAPAVVCIHGGGWTAGSREGWDGVCAHLAERGYVAVTITYRFAPQHPFPAAVNDAKAAVRWLRANAERLKIDPDRIGAVGDSAGGHLSQFLAVTGNVKSFDRDGDNLDQSSRIQCEVNFYGPNDMVRMQGVLPEVDRLVSQFVGGDLEHARHEHIVASPISWVTPDSAPTLIIHGTKDNIVPHDQAIWMRERLQAADVPVELLSIEGAGHGFSGEDGERAKEATLAFFDKHLKSAGK